MWIAYLRRQAKTKKKKGFVFARKEPTGEGRGDPWVITNGVDCHAVARKDGGGDGW